MAFCTHCGKEIPQNTKFCPYCGTPMGNIPTGPVYGNSQAPAGPSYMNGPAQVPPVAPFPGAPVSSAPTPAPKKKSKAGLIVLLSLLGVVLLGGAIIAGILYGKSQDGTPSASEDVEESESKAGKDPRKQDSGDKDSSTGKEDSEDESESSGKIEESVKKAPELSSVSMAAEFYIQDKKLELGDVAAVYVDEEGKETPKEAVTEYTLLVDGASYSEEDPLIDSQLTTGDHTLTLSWEREGESYSYEATVHFTVEAEVVLTINPMEGISHLIEATVDTFSNPEWEYSTVIYEKTGYPTQWKGKDMYAEFTYDAGVFEFFAEGTETLGVMNYDGEILQDAMFSGIMGPIWFREDLIGTTVTTPDGHTAWVYFGPHFDEVLVQERPPFGSGTFPMYYFVGETLYFFDGATTITENTIPEMLKGGLVRQYKEKVSDPSSRPAPDAYVYVASDGSLVEQDGYWADYYYVNGYYSAVKDADTWKFAAIDPTTGQPICDYIYDYLSFFTEGYCPVYKDGKYGLINEQGEEVIPCCLDDITTCYQGKVPIIYNGQFSILDLEATLKGGAVITEEAIQKAFQKVEQVDTYEASEKMMVWIAINNLYIRTGPGTDYSHLSYFITPGLYEITEIQQGAGSTLGWGKLANGEGWVAMDFAGIV